MVTRAVLRRGRLRCPLGADPIDPPTSSPSCGDDRTPLQPPTPRPPGTAAGTDPITPVPGGGLGSTLFLPRSGSDFTGGVPVAPPVGAPGGVILGGGRR